MFYNNGLHFECNGCSLCCRFKGGVVRLSLDDLNRLCEWAGLKKEEFIAVYCQFISDDKGNEFLCLKNTHTSDGMENCIFWNSAIPGCDAYSARPVQCSTYPFWQNILKDKESWNNEKQDCPGINEGPLVTKEVIEEELEKHKNRVPLTRQDLI